MFQVLEEKGMQNSQCSQDVVECIINNWRHACRRRTVASKKVCAKSSSSSAHGDSTEASDQLPETSAKPAKSTGVGRRKSTKQQVTAKSKSLGQADGQEDNDRSARAGSDSAAADSTPAKSKKLLRSKRALVKMTAPAKGVDVVTHGQEGSDVAGRLLQDDKSAHVGNDLDAANSTETKPKKLPGEGKLW